jgi:heat shock protein HslJ
MTDEPGTSSDTTEPSSAEHTPTGPPEKMGIAFYAALALIICLVLMVIILNYPAARASAGLVITRTNWTLQSYTDSTGILVPVITGTGVTARFGLDGSMGGSSGCNHYAAIYSTRDYTIAVSNVTTTLLFCSDPGVMEQESAFQNDLPKTSGFRSSNSYLKFYDAAGKPLMIFIPV